MSTLDFILLAPPIIGGIRGAVKGFLHTVAVFAGYATGFILALYGSQVALDYATTNWSIAPNYALKVVVYALLFFVPALLFRLLAKALSSALNWLSLGVFNNLLGFFVGALKYLAIILSLIYLFRGLPFEKSAAYLKKIELASPVFASYVSLLQWFE